MKKYLFWGFIAILLLGLGWMVLAQEETPIAKIIVESKKVPPNTATTIKIAIRDFPEDGFRELKGTFTFDPRVLQVSKVTVQRPITREDIRIANSTGAVLFSLSDGGANPVREGVIMILDVVSKSPEGLRSELKLTVDSLLDRLGNPFPFEVRNGLFAIGGPNQSPIADAGDDRVVPVGTVVELNAGASSDPDGDPLLFNWGFVTQPAGSTATLSDPTSLAPTFVPDVEGLYVLEVLVDDGFGGTDTDQVEIFATSDEILILIIDILDQLRVLTVPEGCQSFVDELITLMENTQNAVMDDRLEDALGMVEQFIEQVEANPGSCLPPDIVTEKLDLARRLIDLILQRLRDQVLLGDVDLDGRVTILDARLAWEFAQNEVTLTRLQILAADVDGDGQVTRVDADQIAQMAIQPIAVSKASLSVAIRPLAQRYLFSLDFGFGGMPAGWRAQLEIYSASGQRVYHTTRSGSAIQWALRSDTGTPVANGVYLYVITVRDAQGRLMAKAVEKLVVLR